MNNSNNELDISECEDETDDYDTSDSYNVVTCCRMLSLVDYCCCILLNVL